MRKNFYFAFYFLLLTSVTKAQEHPISLQNILPPSPNAASISKFAGINPNLSTGAMTKTIPLYSYSSRDLSVPISIVYYSNGVKVDEIPSRVGTSWSLEAGGVITRHVLGKDDLQTDRIDPPASYPALKDKQLMQFLENVALTTENGSFLDAEYDVFSFNFNGFSGKFILDKNKVPILLNHSNLRVQFTGGNIFKITDDRGIEYFFGEGNAREASNHIAGTKCGRTYNIGPTITAWNLSMMIHPNRDTVWFEYDNITYTYKASISEAIFSNRITHDEQLPCDNTNTVGRPTLENKYCESYVRVKSSLLTKISSSAGNVIQWNYTDRFDIPGEKVLQNMMIREKYMNGLLKQYDFTYLFPHRSKKPFLVELTEKSRANKEIKQTFTFRYENIDNFPPLFSFSKDHYGFYNGQNNSTLIPKPKSLLFQQKLPTATANRDPDEKSTKTGILTEIIYPTGGSEKIFYEINTHYGLDTIHPEPVYANANASSHFHPNITTSVTDFEISFGQEVVVIGSCSFDGRTDQFDPLHNRGRIVLKNNSTNDLWLSENLTPGNSVKKILTLPVGKYSISATASGNSVNTGISINYRPGSLKIENNNKPIGGLRVSKVESRDAAGEKNVKTYHYSKLNNLQNFSSSTIIQRPRYERVYKVYVVCQLVDYYGLIPLSITCDVRIFEYYNMASNTFNNIYIYPGSPVCYPAVIESFGENFENGGIEHHFTVRENFPGGSYLGDYILDAPLVDNSYLNGKETYTHYFKKHGNEFLPVKKVFTSYEEDTRIDKLYKSYVVNKKYNIICPTSDPPSPEDFKVWNCQEYWHYQKWVYPKAIRTLNYDENGIHFIEDVETISYENPDHALPTKFLYSRGGSTYKTILNYYPQDLALNGSAESARLKLIDKHILSPILSQKTINESKETQIQHEYFIFPNNLPLLKSTSLKFGNNPIEKRIEYTRYNTFGKLQEQGLTNDTKEVYLWGYNSKFPVARIIGSNYDIAKTYVNQLILDLPPSELALTSEIDKLRLKLPNSFVSTYTYNSFGGMTKMIDPNNLHTYYEYDAFNRLSIVRDHDKNITKKFCYNYAGQPTDCAGASVYVNDEKSKTFARNNCPTGSTASSITYIVPKGKYTSTISLADANAKAQNDINVNGQSYANANGTCAAPMVYATIELELYIEPGYTTADVYIRFYKDAARTVPASVTDLSVSYESVKKLCTGNTYPRRSVQVANGSEVYLGNQIIDRNDGLHCEYTTFSVLPGNGYKSL